VVVRELGEEVVAHVRVRDVVVQRVEERAVVAVDGGEGPAQPVPRGVRVVGERRVRVLWGEREQEST
jgi:hypothetical protein